MKQYGKSYAINETMSSSFITLIDFGADGGHRGWYLVSLRDDFETL